jgi:hypothetical protein
VFVSPIRLIVSVCIPIFDRLFSCLRNPSHKPVILAQFVPRCTRTTHRLPERRGERRESYIYISPHILMTTSKFGVSFPRYPVFVFSIFFTTSMPSTTFPKTTCFPSRKGVGTVVMKNWEPLPFGPALAMDRRPGCVCLRVKFSSAKVLVP